MGTRVNTHTTTQAAQDQAVILGDGAVLNMTDFNAVQTALDTSDSMYARGFDFGESAIEESMALGRYALEVNKTMADEVLDIFGNAQKLQNTTTQHAVDAAVAQSKGIGESRLPAWIPWAFGGVVVLALIVKGK